MKDVQAKIKQDDVNPIYLIFVISRFDKGQIVKNMQDILLILKVLSIFFNLKFYLRPMFFIQFVLFH